jgi:CRP-like cAMP-binding protein
MARVEARQACPALAIEARTLIKSAVQAIPFSDLRIAMASDPYLACWVAAAVGRRACQIERALARTLVLRVPPRVLAVLEDLAAEHGRAGPDGLCIRFPLTQDLLASMAGATRESVNRAVGDLERRGLVRRVGLRYALPRRAAESPGGPRRSERPCSSRCAAGGAS